MNTGSLSRAHASQIGSSSGSSILRREPSGFFVIDRPKPFPISPTPTAPAATSASSCAIAFSAHPGPTFRKSMPASTRTRSFIFGDAFTSATCRLSASPDVLFAVTISRRFSASISAPICSSSGGARHLRPGMPVEVDGRVLGLRHLVPGRHQRRVRAIVEDARRRHLRGAAIAWPYLGHPRRPAGPAGCWTRTGAARTWNR